MINKFSIGDRVAIKGTNWVGVVNMRRPPAECDPRGANVYRLRPACYTVLVGRMRIRAASNDLTKVTTGGTGR